MSDNGHINLPNNVSDDLKNLPEILKIHRHLSVFRCLIAALMSTNSFVGGDINDLAYHESVEDSICEKRHCYV